LREVSWSAGGTFTFQHSLIKGAHDAYVVVIFAAHKPQVMARTVWMHFLYIVVVPPQHDDLGEAKKRDLPANTIFNLTITNLPDRPLTEIQTIRRRVGLESVELL
jgi:hypothetical protein